MKYDFGNIWLITELQRFVNNLPIVDDLIGFFASISTDDELRVAVRDPIGKLVS